MRTIKRDFFEKALQDLSHAINEKSTPSSSGEVAIRSLECIAALTYSAQHNGEIVSLPFIHDDLKIPAAEGVLKTWKH